VVDDRNITDQQRSRIGRRPAMKKTFVMALSAAAISLAAGASFAQSGSAEGVVRKVDAAAGRVIIKHGDFRGIDMQAMTMAFNVRDKALLEGVRVQDNVRFSVEREGRDYVITGLSRAGAQVLSDSGMHHDHGSH